MTGGGGGGGGKMAKISRESNSHLKELEGEK